MEKRLLKNSFRGTRVASYALIITGLIPFATDFLIILGWIHNFGVFGIFFGTLFVFFGALSLTRPKEPIWFVIGFWYTLLTAVLNLLTFSFLGALFYVIIAERVYRGIDGSRYLKSTQSPFSGRDDILDADI